MKLVKLNRNYNGYGKFTHRIEFFDTRVSFETRRRQYLRIREWLWEHFGASSEQELAIAHNFAGVTPTWAWCSDKFVVYLRDEALTAFMLKKEFWDDENNL